MSVRHNSTQARKELAQAQKLEQTEQKNKQIEEELTMTQIALVDVFERLGGET